MTSDPTKPDPTRDPDVIEEQLVAYLDGELNEETARRIETLAADDPQLRDRLEQLGRTWKMLDQLERTETETAFTESTLELVAVQAEEEAQHQSTELPRRRRRRRIMVIVSLLATSVLGFVAAALLRDNPNRRLMENLPVLRNMDDYVEILDGSENAGQCIEFLRALREKEMFVEEESGKSAQGDTIASAESSRDDIKSRRKLIEQMSPEEKTELAHDWERFVYFAPPRQKELCGLHERLQAEADGEALHKVMRRYVAWLDTLSDSTIDSLKAMPADRRVEEIEKRLYSSEDARALHEWFRALAQRQRAEWAKSHKKSPREFDRAFRHQPAFWFSNRNLEAKAKQFGKIVKPKDLAKLRNKLSSAATRELDALPTRKKKLEWIVRQLERSFQQAQQQWLIKHLGGPSRKVSDKKLAEFFKNELREDTKIWLMSLSGEKMHKNLRLLYQKQRPSPNNRGRRTHDGPGRKRSSARPEYPPKPGHGPWREPGGERKGPPRHGPGGPGPGLDF